MANNIYTTRVEKIWITKEGVIHIEVLPNCYSEFEDAKRSIALCKKLTEKGKRFFIIDLSNGRGASYQSFKYYGGEEAAKICKAAAIIKKTPLSNLVANFFIGIYKPLYPTKLFDSEAAAYEWVKLMQTQV